MLKNLSTSVKWQARQVFGVASGAVAIVVTTANQNSAAVLALNERVAKVAPLSGPAHR